MRESNHRGPLPRRGPGTSSLWKIIKLHAISKLRHVEFHVATKVYIFSSIVHRANIEIRECVKWSLTDLTRG